MLRRQRSFAREILDLLSLEDVQTELTSEQNARIQLFRHILKALISSGEISYVDGRPEHKRPGELRIPRSVQDAVQQHTGQLSEPARRVLTLAAVAGRRFDFSLLQQLTSYDEAHLLAFMKELLAAQLVVEETAEQFAFRHALTRQAIYAGLLARERKALVIAREIGQPAAEVYTLFALAQYLGPHGEYARALEVARAGLALAEQIEHRQWLTAAHWQVGVLLLDLLALPEARHHLEQALVLAREVGSWNWLRIVSAFLASADKKLDIFSFIVTELDRGLFFARRHS